MQCIVTHGRVDSRREQLLTALSCSTRSCSITSTTTTSTNTTITSPACRPRICTVLHCFVLVVIKSSFRLCGVLDRDLLKFLGNGNGVTNDITSSMCLSTDTVNVHALRLFLSTNSSYSDKNMKLYFR